MSEKVFAQGMIVKAPREGAPEYVKASVSFRADEFMAWLAEHKDAKGWVNVDIKEGQSGKWYAQKNVWKPQPPKTLTPVAPTGPRRSMKDELEDEIPF